MSAKLLNNFFFQTGKIILQDIGSKIRPGSLKNLMDTLFILCEKIGTNFSCFWHYYLNLYQHLVDTEIKMAQITSKDTILIIGCGSLPATCVLLAQKINTTIVGIDHDEKAIRDAQHLIKKKKLQKKITLKCAKGDQFSLDDYDCVFVLYGVKNHAKVLKHISETIKNDARIIYRKPQNMQDDLSVQNQNLLGLFYIKKIVHSTQFQGLDSYLLIKK